MNRKKQWLGFLVMVIGACLLLGPFVIGDLETRRQEETVAQIRELFQRPQEATVPTVPPETVPPATPETKPVAEKPEPVTEAATAPAEQAETEPVTQPMTQTEPVTEPVKEAETEAATEAAVTTEPVTEVSTEPEAETAAEPTAEAITEPAADPVTEPTVETVTEPTTEPATVPETTYPDDDFFRAALAYNQNLVETEQREMVSLSSMEWFRLDARDYGFPENVIGTIYIPRLEVEVPIYLGASFDHMSLGFALVGMTSIPLGMENENAVIAGHRGWHGASMLRDIQMMMVGDPIYVTTPWAELTYIVNGIEIVEPNNNSWCTIREGKTMLCLMTCHPYGQSTHRYNVYAELKKDEPEETVVETIPEVTLETVPQVTEETVPETIPEATAEIVPETIPEATVETMPDITAQTAQETVPDVTAEAVVEPVPETTAENLPEAAPKETAKETVPQEQTEPVTLPEPTAAPVRPTEPETEATVPPVQEITLVHSDGTREIIRIDTSAVNPDEREYSTDWSNTLILAENRMRPVAYVTVVCVILVGLWLVIVTIRDARKKGKHHEE